MPSLARAAAVALLAAACVPDGTSAIRLRFDPEFSPPSISTAASRPDLKAAYNRAAFSHMWKSIRVFIEDDSGLRITEGSDSTRLVQLQTKFAYWDATLLSAASSGAQAVWAALNEVEAVGDLVTYDTHRMTMRNAYRPLLGNSSQHYVSTGPRFDTMGTKPYRDISNTSVFNGSMPVINEIRAVQGIAVFNVPMYFMQPSVRVTNASGAPYAANVSNPDLIAECCPLVYEARTTTNEAAFSEQFHTYHAAESLELLSSLPATVPAGATLPDLTVRVMTSAWEFNETDGSPKRFPLTAGPDTEVDIQLTVSWDAKIFATDPLPLSAQEGVDLAPLLATSVVMDGTDASTTFTGDVAIRKRASLLPGGLGYGATFSGVRLLNVSSGVRLNFTMTYPGGKAYETHVLTRQMSPPQPFSRVGMGYTDYTPLWENASRFEFLEAGIDQQFQVPSGDTRVGTAYTIFRDGLYASNGSITALPDVPTRVYRGLGSALQKASAGDCAAVADAARRAWCVSSGYTTNSLLDVGPGILMTAPVVVQAADATQVRLVWNRNGSFAEVRNFESEYPLSLELLDADGNRVIDGPDSVLVPTVTARNATGGEVPLCAVFRARCAGAYASNHVSSCNASEGLVFSQGAVTYAPAVCEAASSVRLDFSVTTTLGAVINVSTDAFDVSASAEIGVMLPYLAHGRPVDLPSRAVRQMVELVSKGHYGPYDGSTISFWLARYGVSFNVNYIYTSPSLADTLAALKRARAERGVRLLIGPFDNLHAEAVSDWIAAEMPKAYAISPNAQLAALEDTTRFFNTYRLRTSSAAAARAMVEALVNRMWTTIAIVQDRSVEPLSDFFYDELRRQGVTVLSDIDVGTVASFNASLEGLLNQTRSSGAKVVFTALAGGFATDVYNNASVLGLSAANGVQWVGNEAAHRSFAVDDISSVQTAFAGAIFLTEAMGYNKAASDWFNHHYVTESRELYQSLGGMDPFFVSKRGFDFTDLGPWAQQQLMLVGDSILLTGWMWFWAIQGGHGTNAQQAAWETENDSPTWICWTGQCNFGAGSHARESYRGMWVQVHDNYTTLRDSHSASVPYNPWQITTGVSQSLGATSIVEGAINNLLTALPYPAPTWGPNISLARRTYTAVANINELGATSTAVDYVPATHACAGGCGGGVINTTVSVYAFRHGTCASPDNCVCRNRNSTGTPAFGGPSCESAVCTPTCSANGNCTFDFGTEETSCVCEAGWTGATCGVPLCNLHGCAAASGTCVLPDTCQCAPGFFGPDCSGVCACGDGSVCNDGSSGSGECTCSAGKYGVTCASKCTCEHGTCNDGSRGNGLCTSCDSGYIGDNCDTPLAAVAVPSVFAALMLCILALLLIKCFMRRAKRAALLQNMDWRVDWEDVSMQKAEMMGQSMAMQSMKFQSTTSIKGGAERATNVAKWKGSNLVVVEKIARSGGVELTAALREEVRDVREARHTNLLAFVGACIDKPNVSVLSAYCSKGSLDNILANPNVKLDMTFKESILKDIAKGLVYLHGGPIGAHGRLSSDQCVIDSRWTVKVGGFGLPSIRHLQEIDEEMLVDADAMASSLFWTSPEVLRNSPQTRGVQDIEEATVKGDVYAFGVIVSEVLTRTEPYFDSDYGPSEVVRMVMKGPAGSQKLYSKPSKEAWTTSLGVNGDHFRGESARSTRPTLPTDGPEAAFADVARGCWAESPDHRPTMGEVTKQLETLSPNKGEMIDNLIRMLEKYATNLEGIVAERTSELEAEKNKVDELVCRMLPRAIVEDLKAGKDVKAESFDNVTIFFSDIVGFTSICAKSSPLQVVDLLNKLYTTFDTIIDEYDVYKVETIGDAYMVVSGLPGRNGDRHAGEIASMSLHLLSAMIDFEIPHLPGEKLQLRIGMHSGPVVAGVVGKKMPRYCLFGDTVNISSRMESGGLALRIHMSETTQALLAKLGGYHITLRGEREVKGRGVMKTFWLTGKDGFTMPLPSQDMAVSESQHEFK